ncbi:MAG TPA: DUF3592 domain-containing protein [Oculatellaceae cyanobacterium]
MDNSQNYELALQRQPPRNVEHRQGTWGKVKPFFWFLLPHTWIAVAAPVFLCFYLTSLVVAEPFPGTVTSLQVRQGKKSTYNNVQATYTVDDTTYNMSADVDSARFNALHEGEPISIYAVRSFPKFMPRLDKCGDNELKMSIFLTIWVAFWDSIVGGMLYVAIMKPLKRKSLVQCGTAVQGTITRVWQRRGRNNTYHHVDYTFPFRKTDKKSGRTVIEDVRGSMYILSSEKAAASELEGKPVTILVDQQHPTNNVVYQFSDWKAVN